MRVLVTGGAGFIGSHLVDALLAGGHAVRVLESLEPQVHGRVEGAPPHLARAAELRVADVRDREAVRAALDGVEVVFHQAAAVGIGQSMYEIERYVSANAVGAAVLLEALVDHRRQLRRVVVASSMSLYGEGACRDAAGALVHPGLRPGAQLEGRRWDPEDEQGHPLVPVATPESAPLAPTSVYAVTKRDHEELFLTVGRAYEIPTVALRYFNVYGPRQALGNPYTGVVAIFSSRLLAGRAPLVFEDGGQSRDFVHVSDVVRANLLAMQADAAVGRVFNVGTGRATPVLEVAEALARALDLPLAPEITGRFRAGDVRHCFADVSAITGALGFEARTSLEAGLRELLGWLRSQGRAGALLRPDGVEQARRELEQRGLAR
jgi:dTDP-L-rhamnose 4-epimerase